MLYVPETPDVAQRIRLAKAAGLDAVEFWKSSNKDVDAIAAALAETGLPLAGIVAEPMLALTDPATHDAFLSGLKTTIAIAQRLKTNVLIAQAGPDLPGVPRADQRAALVSVLTRAADLLVGTDIRIAVEPLNTLVDHKGYFLPSTSEGLDIVDEIDRPEIALLYDLYHSMVMGEVTSEVLAGRVDRVAHIHIADHPGRNQPGTGGLDLTGALSWLFANGYDGFVGLEFRPTEDTASALAQMRSSISA